MKNQRPRYDTYIPQSEQGPENNEKQFGIRVAHDPSDLMKVVAIRSAVFLSEQRCPFEEEFDGNDLCASHLIGHKGDEPVACIRARFFAEFCKLERLAVRHEYRNTRMSFDIVRAGIELARKKGYRRIYGHAQDRLLKFWMHFGAKPLPKKHKLIFSDFSYTEVLLEVDPHPDPITVDSDPFVIIRPEGAWHKTGILEQSASRPVTSPLVNLKVA